MTKYRLDPPKNDYEAMFFSTLKPEAKMAWLLIPLVLKPYTISIKTCKRSCSFSAIFKMRVIYKVKKDTIIRHDRLGF